MSVDEVERLVAQVAAAMARYYGIRLRVVRDDAWEEVKP